MSKGKFALGAIIGAAAGVVAGILTAPKSGKETRADLKAKADELKSDAEKTAADVKKKGEKVYKDARKNVESIVNEGKKTVEDYRDRATRAVNGAKKRIRKRRQEKITRNGTITWHSYHKCSVPCFVGELYGRDCKAQKTDQRRQRKRRA